METYLFDFDGTLVDSMPVYAKTILEILDENSVSYPKDIIKILATKGTFASAEYMVELGLPMTSSQVLEIMKERFLDAYLYSIPPKEGVVEALLQFKREGKDLNVLTASPHISLDPCLKRLGLMELFTNVWSTDDLGLTKTDPEIYRKVTRLLGVKEEEILFFDDNPDAGKCAQSAGLKFCAVYDITSASYEESLRKTADAYIKSFSELIKKEVKKCTI